MNRRGTHPSQILRWGAISVVVIISVCLTIVVVISLGNTITPKGIVVHHSAVPIQSDGNALDAALISKIHRQRGFGIFYWGTTYHIGYHYVILPNGTIEQGRPEKVRGAHTKGHNETIGICLIGDFSSQDNINGDKGPTQPTREQIQTLLSLINDLQIKYQISPENIRTHRELDSETECPGDKFPLNIFTTGVWRTGSFVNNGIREL